MKRAIAVLALVTLPVSTAAHTLDVGTARVTLRDGHVEVLAEWDLFLLVDGDPTTLATAPEAELAGIHRRVVERIERETRLVVDGVPRKLALTAGPAPPELRAFAAALSAGGQTHGSLARLRLEAPEALTEAHAVSLSVPAALGPVAITFVQPATRYVAPGQAASFTVLTPPHPSPPATESRGLGFITLVACLALAAGLAINKAVP